jgi:hypothetical protein
MSASSNSPSAGFTSLADNAAAGLSGLPPAALCASAAATHSEAAPGAPVQAPGPSLATGMSGDPANAGGEHEEVAKLSHSHSALGSGSVFETTSLVADAAKLDEIEHSGTAPGACGPERDIFGAANSELCSPDWPIGPQINRARCVEAGLRADRAPDGSISGDRTTERFSGTATKGLVCRPDPSRLVTGGRDRQPNSVSDGPNIGSLPLGESDPSVTLDFGPSGFKSRACEGNGSNAGGSKTADGSARYSFGGRA